MGRIDTKIIVDEVVSRTIGKNEAVSFRRVKDARIPGGIKGFLLGGLLEKYSRREVVGTGSEPVFEALLRTISLDHRYERANYLIELDRAAGFLSDYLIRPRESLLRWIFGEREDVPVATMRRKTAFVADYRYLLVLLDAWVRRHRLVAVSREQLRSLISAIDDRVVAKHSDVELGMLTRPIFGFVLFGSSSSKQEIPLDILREFYLEKSLDTFWSGLEPRLGAIQTVGFAHLMRCVSGLTTIPVQPREVAPPDAPSKEISADQAEEPGPLRNLETQSGEIVQPVILKGTTMLPDLSEFISDEKKELFVNAVFEHDRAYYTAVITSLSSLATWKEAALFLSQFYQTNGLDPFADEVVEFTDAIHSRYDGAGRR